MAAEQRVKVLELMSARESAAIYEASGLPCMLTFVRSNAALVHKDTLHSAMSVITRLCARVDAANAEQMPDVGAQLADLLDNEDAKVVECALKVPTYVSSLQSRAVLLYARRSHRAQVARRVSAQRIG